MAVEAAAALLGVNPLWHALVRPVSASSVRLQAIASPAVTLKINGVRLILVISEHEEAIVVRMSGEESRRSEIGPAPPGAIPLTVVDCEERAGKLHALDVLVVAGRDVRFLPLEARLEALSLATPEGLSLKPYDYLPRECAPGREAPEALMRRALSAMKAHKSLADGLIILDAADPYWIPPLKFKPVLTCDFILESARHSDDYVILVVTGRGDLVVWREYDSGGGMLARVQLPLKLTRELASQIGGNRPVNRNEAVVVECVRVSDRSANNGSSFRVVALRPDRTRPNRAAVVLENVQLQAAGCNLPKWLMMTVPPADPAARFWRYVQACWRALIVATGCKVNNVRVSAEGCCKCAPFDPYPVHHFQVDTTTDYDDYSYCPPPPSTVAFLSFLNLGEKHGTPERLVFDAIKEEANHICVVVGALILQPQPGFGRNLYHCENIIDNNHFRLQVGSTAVHDTGVRVQVNDNNGMEARAALLGFKQQVFKFPPISNGLGVTSRTAGPLVAGLSAFLWVRPPSHLLLSQNNII